MFAAARVVGWALVGLYDETFLLLKANLVWFAARVILGLPVLLVITAAMTSRGAEAQPVGLLTSLLLTGLLLVLLPNPASLGLYGLAARMQRKESPRWREFWDATRLNLRLGLGLYVVGLAGVLVLSVAAGFYLGSGQPALQALSLLYAYLALFWLALQIYLGPLVAYLGERRPLALYRRASLLVLGHPMYVLSFLLTVALLMLLCIFLVPLYPGLAMAFVALMATRGLAELKRKYDPEPEADEGAA